MIATVIDVEEHEGSVDDVMLHQYRVSARWQDPLTERSYVYQSAWISTLPRVLHSGQSKVNVYIHPENPEQYLFLL